MRVISQEMAGWNISRQWAGAYGFYASEAL